MLLFFLFLVRLSAAADEFTEFISPVPGAEVAKYDKNPTWVLGSQMDVRWEPSEKPISLVLYQEKFGPFETIFSELRDIGSYTWTVATEKDLSVSEIFYFQLFIKGQDLNAASGHYFNITRTGRVGEERAKAEGLLGECASTNSSSGTTSGGTSPSGIKEGATGATCTPLSSASPIPAGGMSLGSKIGLGIGIPVAVILGVIAGLIFSARRRRPVLAAQPSNTPANYQGYTSVAERKPSTKNWQKAELDSYRPPVELPPGPDTR